MENFKDKQQVLIAYTQIEKDESVTKEVKQYRKDIVMLETFLEIRDLLKDIKNNANF